MTIVKPRYEGNTQSLEEIAELYQVPLAKAKFYSHLIEAWHAGQEAAIEDCGENTIPYDLAVYGVSYLLNVLGIVMSPAQVTFNFYSFVSRIPSNADPIMVLNELRYQYPDLERSGNGQRTDRRQRVIPAGSNTQRNRTRQK